MFINVPHYHNSSYVNISQIVQIVPNGPGHCKILTTAGELPATLSAEELIERIIQITDQDIPKT